MLAMDVMIPYLVFKWRTICVVCFGFEESCAGRNESNAHGLHNGDVHLHVFVVLLLCCFFFYCSLFFFFFFYKLLQLLLLLLNETIFFVYLCFITREESPGEEV